MAARVQRAIELMLYRGYVGRNPIRRLFNRDVLNKICTVHDNVVHGAIEKSKGSTMALRGIPGMGKTRVIERCLSLYRPVIYHTKYRGEPFSFQQRVWIKLNCPSDGTVRGLCINFLQELDRLFQTNYYKRYGALTKYELVQILANLILLHGIGILVIDEIQNLLEAKVEGERVMLNFFVQLENTLGLPIILVGTYAADSILCGRYHQLRRADGEGHFEWTPIEYGDEWELFTQALWSYQVVKNNVKWNTELSKALHDVSFGVTDIALRVFRFAQEEAIDNEVERLTPTLIRETAYRHCPLTVPIIDALRSQDWTNEVLEDLDDVLPLYRRKQGKTDDDQAQQVNSTTSENKSCEEDPNPDAGKMDVKGKRPAQSRGKPQKSKRCNRSIMKRCVVEGQANGIPGAESLKKNGLIATPDSVV